MALLDKTQAKFDMYIKKVFLYMPTYYQFNKRNIENDVFCFYVGYKKMLKIIPKVEYVAYPSYVFIHVKLKTKTFH